jgi:serine/threonine protein kinase
VTLKITDFGLAKVFDDAVTTADAPYIARVLPEGSSLTSLPSHETVDEATQPRGQSVFATRTGVGAGTASHMAPEQFDDVKRVDVRADVYSFGVMLFQLVTGRLPFTGHSQLEYRRLHQTVKPAVLRTAFPGLNSIVARCLAKHPGQRFDNFLELREALEASMYDKYETYIGLDVPPPAHASEFTEDELLQKALSLVELNQHQRALRAFEQAIERNPKRGAAWRGKGLLLMDTFHRFGEALASLEQAQRLGEQGLEERIVLCREKLT